MRKLFVREMRFMRDLARFLYAQNSGMLRKFEENERTLISSWALYLYL